jgi:2-oxoglutarate/2-oxoacid ferredoxin oxidoreductase subunit alpha
VENNNCLSFMLGGPAGHGIKSAGLVFARTCSRSGLQVFTSVEYPSLIRGDHNSVQVMVASDSVCNHTESLDLLLALDRMTYEQHRDDVRAGGVILIDYETTGIDPAADTSTVDDGIRYVNIPLKQIVAEVGGTSRMINLFGLGAAMGALNFEFQRFSDTVADLFAKLPEEVLEKNLAGARAAYDVARQQIGTDPFCCQLTPSANTGQMLITGNEAISIGAIKAGLKVYTGYPMTPASSIQDYLSLHGRDYQVVVKHTEDEISAVGAAVGAGFAGARAMTASSGGGFSLMVEFLGMASMAEIPVVIAEVQRPGPATGLPTRTEQGDLAFVLSASQGEFPRIVIAPGDVEECFYLAFDAFNLAEKYQLPVILLSDKHLAESYWSAAPFDQSGMTIERGEVVDRLDQDADYKRYQFTDSGVSPRTLPGTPNGMHTAPSDEHDEYGRMAEDEYNRASMVEKRQQKLDDFDTSAFGFKRYGPQQADFTIIGWGSTKGGILDAMEALKALRPNLKINFVQVIYMDPFPADGLRKVLDGAGKTICIEMNSTSQLAALFSEKLQFQFNAHINKYDGRQFMTEELVASIENAVAAIESEVISV